MNVSPLAVCPIIPPQSKCVGTPPGCQVRSSAYQQYRENRQALKTMRAVVIRSIDDRDRSGLDTFRSSQAYLDDSLISQEEFELFPQFRDSMTNPCESAFEFRIFRNRTRFEFESMNARVRFERQTCTVSIPQ